MQKDFPTGTDFTREDNYLTFLDYEKLFSFFIQAVIATDEYYLVRHQSITESVNNLFCRAENDK